MAVSVLMVAALALLLLAAAGGATLFSLHLRGRRVRPAAGFAHAGVALTGVVALAVMVFGGSRPLPVNAALLMFVLALVGGGFVLLFRLDGEPPPGFMIVLHALAALTGLALLVSALLI